MKRDTKIVLGVVAAVPALILTAAAACSAAIASGASMQWRLAFRLMCHGIAHRCLMLFGVPMPICARCTGIYLGMLGGVLLFPFAFFLRARIMSKAALLAVMPLMIDGTTQLLKIRESTNALRLSTGALAGLAFGLWVLSAIERRDERPAESS